MRYIFFSIILFSSSITWSDSELIGIWSIKPMPDSEDQFPWWQQIKYPQKLEITQTENNFQVTFTDQYGNTCEGTALSVNLGKEIAFTYCGGLGTKHPESWDAIHHAKVVNEQLEGVVKNSQYLFKWLGTKQ